MRRSSAEAPRSSDNDTTKQFKEAARSTAPIGGYRSVSFDEDTGHVLYNSDVQQNLGKFASRLSRHVDVIGFDACLMSMLETAYGLRNAADVMVSSEELEPGPGWDYANFLEALKARPEMSGVELANAVLAAYQARYGDRYISTLSVLDLQKTQAAAGTLTALVNSLLPALSVERRSIEGARAKLTTYGADERLHTSIDLFTFLQFYADLTSNAQLRQTTQAALSASNQVVLSNYASKGSTERSGSNGLAIYFPATRSDFDADPYKQGYLKSNRDHVVEFVARERWADFLQSYLR
ncbi:clostripain-related cysteine peptidase [Bradyrhizobium sp. UFLA05-153]